MFHSMVSRHGFFWTAIRSLVFQNKTGAILENISARTADTPPVLKHCTILLYKNTRAITYYNQLKRDLRTGKISTYQQSK